MKGVEMRSATKCRNKVEAGIPPPRNCPSTRDLVSSFPPLSLPGSVVLEARPDSFSLESSSRFFVRLVSKISPNSCFWARATNDYLKLPLSNSVHNENLHDNLHKSLFSHHHINLQLERFKFPLEFIVRKERTNDFPKLPLLFTNEIR